MFLKIQISSARSPESIPSQMMGRKGVAVKNQCRSGDNHPTLKTTYANSFIMAFRDFSGKIPDMSVFTFILINHTGDKVITFSQVDTLVTVPGGTGLVVFSSQ